MEELYCQYKSLLFTLAYQITGSAAEAEAEDAVQDVFIKAYDVHPERLEEPKVYLCKMVTNRCLDLQKSAEEKGNIRRSVATRTFSHAGGGYDRVDDCPERYAILRHARFAREADADRESGFRPA